MAIDPEAEFPFHERPFVFAFRPDKDTFDDVHIERTFDSGGEWQLSPVNPFIGEQCLELRADPNTETASWVFSRPFNFYAEREYEAVIYYRGSDDMPKGVVQPPEFDTEVVTPAASIDLWLGKNNEPDAMERLLIENGVSSPDYQYLRVRFSVPEDDKYYFGGLGKIAAGRSSIAMGLNAATEASVGLKIDDFLR